MAIQTLETQHPVFLTVCTTALASPSSGCGRFLGPNCLSGIVNAMEKAFAAEAWLLLAMQHCQLEQFWLRLSLTSVCMSSGFQDTGFLVLNCLCPICGRNTITAACQAHSGHLGNLKSVLCPMLRYTTLAAFLGLLIAICLLPAFSFELSSICRNGLLHLICQYVIASSHCKDK